MNMAKSVELLYFCVSYCIMYKVWDFRFTKPGIILTNVRRKRHAKPQKTYKSVSAAHRHCTVSRSWCHTQTVHC